MTAALAHFSITGEYLTSIARELMLSEDPGAAYRLLRRGLVGFGTANVAEQVLAGTHDLTGDSDEGISVAIAAQTPELARYLKDLRYIYAGRYRDGKGWRRPVAVVTGFNRDDARYASEHLSRTPTMNDRMFTEWSRRRVEYYCTGGERVTRVKMPGSSSSQWIIWEPCSEMPQWHELPTTEEDALREYLEHRTLQQRSAFDEDMVPTYADDDPGDDGGIPASPVPLSYWRSTETDEEVELRERQYQDRLTEIGEQVRKQAGDDTFVLTLEDGREVTVARAPFVRWALRRTDYADAAPPWDNVAEMGMKLPLDDPNHTDWMLGAGLSLADSYSNNITGPAYEEMFKLQEAQRRKAKPEAVRKKAKRRDTSSQEPELYSGIVAAIQALRDSVHPATVLADHGVVEGVVGETIAVFPDSAPERVTQLRGVVGVVGVVVERGGQIAHFAIVARERGLTVLVHPNACTLFTEGSHVQLNPKTGRIIVADD